MLLQGMCRDLHRLRTQQPEQRQPGINANLGHDESVIDDSGGVHSSHHACSEVPVDELTGASLTELQS